MRNFLMIDTETFGFERTLYEYGFTMVRKGSVIATRSYLVTENLENAENHFQQKGNFPKWFPDRIAKDFDAYWDKSFSRDKVVSAIVDSIEYARKNKLKIIAKNPGFDIPVIEQFLGTAFFQHEEVFDMQRMLVNTLPKKYAFYVPYTKSGLATFRADYLVPFILGDKFVQTHDAGGDSLNQSLIVLKLAKRKKRYSDSGKVYEYMRDFHAKYDIPLYSGTGFLPE